MKKLIAIVLAVMLAVSCTIAVSAANATPGTTTLTTTVPDAEYQLNIPADQEIDFGETSVELEVPTVSASSGFASGKDLAVTVNYTSFSCPNTSTKIPISLYAKYMKTVTSSQTYYEYSEGTISNGAILTFSGQSSGTVSPKAYDPAKAEDRSYVMQSFIVKSNSKDWGKALAGDYTATITFSAEVVAAE